MTATISELDNFDLSTREKTLEALLESQPAPQAPADLVLNLHIHSFFSFNCCGYSPSRIVWEARQHPLALAGLVDFDVLDGVEEFIRASKKANLPYVCSIESRVFVPEFSDRVINSPGEPGIAYHMGVGFTSTDIPADAQTFLDSMKSGAAKRNEGLVERVNAHTAPLILDLDQDVGPLVPAGNATERHICLAYARKAASQFTAPTELNDFWKEKLGDESGLSDLPEGPAFLNLLRAKTMKKGGVGYVTPGTDSFPGMADMNAFTLACGGIPTAAWLDGTTDGEQCMAELLDVSEASGAEALNIIPDRNFTAGEQNEKLKNLQEVIELAVSRDFPVLVGTEMNSPGNKFVDDFDSAELSPFMPVFIEGAHIAYGHMIMQSYLKCGYTSDWAKQHFPTRKVKNEFFAKLGEAFSPKTEEALKAFGTNNSPEEILQSIN